MNTATELELTAASIDSTTVTTARNDIVSVSPSSSSTNDGKCDVDIAAPTFNANANVNVNANANANSNATKTPAATMNVIVEEEPAITDPVTKITKSVIKENENTTITTTTYNNEDVLCGRGKGIREHPGNQLYNKLLREHYEEYANAPKGSKLSFVKIVVNTIRSQKPLGGRFLELKNDSIVYTDIGDVRALNKTAQAFRDMRVAEEKRQHVQKRRLLFNMKHQQTQSTASISSEKRKMVGGGEGVSPKSALKTTSKKTMHRLSPPLPIMAQQQQQQQPRRPTYQERLKLFQQQQKSDELRKKRKDCSEEYEDDDSDNDEDCSCSSSSSTEDDNNDDGDNDSISDTETEDSFPIYNSSRKFTQNRAND